MKILLTCPIPPEFNSCFKVLNLKKENVSGITIGKRIINGITCIALKSGAGKVKSAESIKKAIMLLKLDIIIDTGTCGAVSKNTKIGDIIISNDCFEYENSKLLKKTTKITSSLYTMNNTWMKRAKELATNFKYSLKSGTMGCGPFLLNSKYKKNIIFEDINAEAFNWETYTILKECLDNDIKALSIRVVTDRGDKKSLRDFLKNVKKETKRLYELIKLMIENDFIK